MNSSIKQLLAVSALLIAGAASAQPVPAEEWAGAPIAAPTSTLSRAEVRAELGRSANTAPQEQWVGSAAGATVAAGKLSRAEVLADLKLWKEAGLDTYAHTDSPDAVDPHYNRRLQAYQHARAEAAQGRALAGVQSAPTAN